jgi:spermidine synthase
MMSLGLPSAENYWSREIARRNGSIYHTLRSVFRELVVLPGDHNFFLVSDSPLPSDPSLITHRLRERGIETRWVTPAYIEYIFTTDRFRQTRQELDAVREVKLNRDLVPICYFYDMVLWASLFYSGLSNAFETASLLSLAWLAAPLILLVMFLRAKKACSVPLIAAVVGFAGMALEVAIVFAFQVLKGYVYHEVGLIIASFMAGLAMGAVVSDRLLMRGGARHTLLLTLMAMTVYAIALPLTFSASAPVPDFVFPILALLAGSMAGACFPSAVALTEGVTGRVVGLIYGADLVGGCLGAILVSGLFIPVLGIPQTCYAAALLTLAGFTLLI